MEDTMATILDKHYAELERDAYSGNLHVSAHLASSTNLEPQPAAKSAYTDKDIQMRMERRENGQHQVKEGGTTKAQSTLGITNIKKQANRIKSGLPEVGQLKGLANNLRASAKGTNKPTADGLFGPFRNII